MNLYNHKYIGLLEKVTFSIVIFMHESSLVLECNVDSSLVLEKLYLLQTLDAAHLLSFAKQNFSVQMTRKSTLLSLTFLGLSSPSTISFLTVSLSSQMESTSPLISSQVLIWKSLGLDDPSSRKYSLCLPFFAYDCRSSGGLFSFRYHQPLLKKKKSKTIFPLNFVKIQIF